MTNSDKPLTEYEKLQMLLRKELSWQITVYTAEKKKHVLSKNSKGYDEDFVLYLIESVFFHKERDDYSRQTLNNYKNAYERLIEIQKEKQ